MSATDWRQCPRCICNRRNQIAIRRKGVEAMYGNFPVDQYEKAKAELAEFEKSQVDEHLRIDASQGIDDGGMFHSSFKAHCKDCGYEFEHEYEERTEV